MESLSALLISGLVFGVSGGLTPGPLLTLVISQTLRFGAREGVKVAVVPVITDLPIILFAMLVLTRLAEIRPLLGAVTLAGALFLIWLGWESVTFKGVEYADEPVKPRSIRKGVVANFLNPSPYLFWFTIGGPVLLQSRTAGIAGAVLFVASLYAGLIGSKIVVAVLAGRSRHFLKSRNYVFALRFLGLVLWVYAAVFLKDSLGYFGIL